MRYLTLNEVLDLYRQVMEQSGSVVGILDLNALESAVAQLHDFGTHNPALMGLSLCDTRLRRIVPDSQSEVSGPDAGETPRLPTFRSQASASASPM